MIARFHGDAQKDNKMPSTAGTVDATPTRRILHLTYIDFNGKPRTDSYDIDAADTDAEINALVAAVGAATNANLWRVAITNEFTTGVGLASEATNAPDDSIADNIVTFYKNATNLGFDFFIPAPLEEMIVDGTEDVDKLNATYLDVHNAVLAIWNGYSGVSVGYTERRKKNKRKRF